MPVVDTLVMLPVSLFGIGLRETVFDQLLGGLFGISLEKATLTSLGGFLLQVMVGLSGALCLPFTAGSQTLKPEDDSLALGDKKKPS